MLSKLLNQLDFTGKITCLFFLLIAALLPIHAVISTLLISNFGHADIFKSWKEILICIVLIPFSSILLWKLADKSRVYRTYNKLIFLFILLNVILIFVYGAYTKQEVVGTILNLRYLVYFLVAQILVLQYKGSEFKDFFLRIIFWGGVLVVVFGTLQVLVLPDDFLRHFGYRQGIILPYYTVDDNNQLIRIISTLRGTNQLGAYLVFWLPILALVTKRMWNVATKYRYIAAVIWLASLITLYGSRSRSGYLGAVIALGVFVFLQSSILWQKRFIIIGGAVAVMSIIVIGLAWNTRFVQITLIHNDPSLGSGINSNEQHVSSLQEAIKTVRQHPFGLGVGSTNVASTYGSNPRTVENYYLAIAVELGAVGLVIYLAILILVALQLWNLHHDDIAAALLASFAGLLVINLLLPAWGDETLSMLWWGMAGIVISTPLVKIKKRATI